MKPILIIIALIASSSLIGQTSMVISGKVKSEEGAIPDAYVTIGTQGGITDAYGKFNFQYSRSPLPDTIRIQVSALGYREQIFDYPQSALNTGDLIITLSLFPDIDSKTALEDIENGKVRFLLSSGIAPVIYNSDKKFTRKYGVTFYEFGCETIAREALKSYNEQVAKYLDLRHGKTWREIIRPDIVGID